MMNVNTAGFGLIDTGFGGKKQGINFRLFHPFQGLKRCVGSQGHNIFVRRRHSHLFLAKLAQ